jgi:transcriptional regulator with XRE-family HTH domain
MAKASKHSSRGATPVDAHIGQKIRARRNLLGVSQTELADAAGITFQQIQKYEKGVNRVEASRLQQFSEALGVPPSYFLKAYQLSERRRLRSRKASYRKTQSFNF